MAKLRSKFKGAKFAPTNNKGEDSLREYKNAMERVLLSPLNDYLRHQDAMQVLKLRYRGEASKGSGTTSL